MLDEFTKRRLKQMQAKDSGRLSVDPNVGTSWAVTQDSVEPQRLVSPSNTASLVAAFKETPVFNDFKRIAMRLSHEEDPSFNPLPLIEESAQKVGWKNADRLANTRSQGEYDALMSMLERQEFNNQLVANSALSTVASIPISMMNAQDLLAMAATAGISAFGTVVRSTAKAVAARGITANTIKAGVAGTLGSGVGGAITYEANSTFTAEDVMIGNVINSPLAALYGRTMGKVRVPLDNTPKDFNNVYDVGGAMGASIRSIFRRFDKNFYTEYTAAGIKQEKEKQRLREAIAAGGGDDMFVDGISNLEWSKLIEEFGDIPDAVYDEYWRANKMDERVRNITKIEAALDEAPAWANTLYARLFRSGVREAQALAINTLESGTGAVVNNRSTASIREYYKNNIWDGYVSPYSSYLRSYQKRRYNDNIGAARNKDSVREKFNRFQQFIPDKRAFDEEVFLYTQSLRRGDSSAKQWSPEVVEYYDKFVEPMNKRVLELAQQAGVEGFDMVQYLRGFMPQRHNRQMYQRALAKMNGDRRELSKLLQKAIMSPNGMGLTDATKARKIADAFIRRFLDDAPRAGINQMEDDAWTVMDEILKQNNVELPEGADLKSFVTDEVSKQERSKRRNTYAHARIPLDYEVEHMGVRMIDLLDTDVENVLANYAIQMSGQIAMAETGFKSMADFKKVAKRIVDKDSTLADAMKQLEAGLVTGRSTEIDNKFILASVKAGVLAYLNNMGMTQLIESQTAAATLGISNYFKNLGGAAMEMYRGRKTPRAERLAKESAQALLPIGRYHWFNKPGLNKEITANPSLSTTSIGQKTDAVSNLLLTVQGYTSGFHHVRAAQEWATAESIMNLVTGAIRDGGDVSRKTKRLLHTMGYDQKLLTQVEEQVTKHAVKEDGVWNFNVDKWDSRVAMDYSLTMQRGMAQMVQRTMLGEELPFMGTNTGALLTQFMSFPVTALRKQLARNATIGNETLFATTLMGVLMGGTVITARNYLTGSNTEADFEAVLRNGIVYNSNFGTPAYLWDLGLSLTGAPDAWRINPWSAIHSDLIAPVGVQAINDMSRIPGALLNFAAGTADADDYRAVKAMPVIGGHIGTARFMRKDNEDE